MYTLYALVSYAYPLLFLDQFFVLKRAPFLASCSPNQMRAMECLHFIRTFSCWHQWKGGEVPALKGNSNRNHLFVVVSFNSSWLEINHILPFFAFRTEKYFPQSFALTSQARSILMTSGNIFLYGLQKRVV